jgi:hypothetical protein
MRAFLASAFFLGASAFGVACSSSSSSPGTPAQDGGGGNDAQAQHDGGTAGDSGDNGIDISGSKAIKISVFKYDVPAPTPYDGIRARIETLGNTGHIDVKTAPDGTATFNVDPSKGPFDITVAETGVQAVSILGVTDSVPGNIVINPLTASTAFKDVAISGAIAGVTAGNKVQLDAWDFATVVSTVGATTFTSKYNYSAALKTKIGIAAIEVDPQGTAVKGYLTALTDRTGLPMKIDVDMANGVAPTISTVNIKWPTAGLLTGTTIKAIDPKIVNDTHLGNSLVEKNTPDEVNAAMFCGIADVSLPSNGISKFKLQVFGGTMAPDVAATRLTTVATGGQPNQNDVSAYVQPHDLTDNATLEVGAVTSFKTAGTNLGDVQVSADTTGYDYVQVIIADAKAGDVWAIYGTGSKLATRGLPTLPAGVTVPDIAGDITPLVFLLASKYATGAKPAWEASGPSLLFNAQTAGGLGVDQTGR